MMATPENDPRRAGVIWALNLDEPLAVIIPLTRAIFRRVGPESVPALAEAMGGDASGEILKRFESGRRCYTAWVADKLAAYGWVSFNEEHIGELNLRLTLLPGEAYIWDCATLPAYRQNYLYSALLVYILEELRTEGLCRVWIGADVENVASQRGIARAGFRLVADLLIARVLALRSVWMQGRPDVPDDLVAEARRAFLNSHDRVWQAAAEELGNSR
jgi:ribosomal protein S18 acetylase RimI-like enzyme